MSSRSTVTAPHRLAGCATGTVCELVAVVVVVVVCVAVAVRVVLTVVTCVEVAVVTVPAAGPTVIDPEANEAASVASPANCAETATLPEGWLTPIWQEPLPLESVVAVHVC